MGIISFAKDTVIDYVPEYGGNRESEEPCVVGIRFVPYSEVQRYSRLLSARVKGVRNDDKLAEIGQQVQKKQFCEHVESISGYSVDGKEVTDPAEFYETADTDLVIEIIKAMESQQRLNEGQAKNFAPPSDGD